MNYTDVAIKATIRAEQVVKDAGKSQDIDRWVQAAIIDTILSRFPEHDIMAEEGYDDLKGSPYLWIVDPLDGTYNFMAGFPFFCTSIAIQHEGKTVFGVVKNLFSGDLFVSGLCSSVSETESLPDAIVAIDWPASEARAQTLEVVKAISGKVKTLRSLGSSALSLCYVSRGWLDGFIHVDLEPWDAAAGAFIVGKAGGKVTDFEGNPWTIASRQLVASNGWLHDELLAIIQ